MIHFLRLCLSIRDFKARNTWCKHVCGNAIFCAGSCSAENALEILFDFIEELRA